MKRAAGLVFAAICIASSGSSLTYYALDVRGGSRIIALDQPVRKGRQLLFHRYPDGVYVSLAAEEVLKIESVAEAPEPPPGTLAPGETVWVGPALSGPNYEAPPQPAAAPPPYGYGDGGYGYGYSYWSWGGTGPRPPHPHPPPRPVPSNIGPNGFPIIAPPGSAGSAPPAIGPNGFPILSPQPQPVRRP